MGHIRVPGGPYVAQAGIEVGYTLVMKVMNEVEYRYVDEIEEHLCVKSAQKHFHEIEPWSKSHPLLFVSSNLRKTTSHLKDIMKIYIICLLSGTLFLIFFFSGPNPKEFLCNFCNDKLVHFLTSRYIFLII